ncbi:MAG: hypothetical protein JXR83_17040 [Deltaproteobacteria bacterium]|nr:hypothetical protein [Deltaproteobacteria bacterium]
MATIASLAMATALATLAPPLTDAEVIAQAHSDRGEIAGWLRGTDACRAGRVPRRIAELLRQRGVDARFHSAGHGGGFTVATVGPAGRPLAALLVAPAVACPQAPDNADLEYGATARATWRAAAIMTALTALAREANLQRGVRALFLGGDAAGGCGRGFVDNALPGLAGGAPILDEGGLLLVAHRPPILVLGTAYLQSSVIWLSVRDGERDPADRLDRALALCDGFQLDAAPSPAAAATVEAIERSLPGRDPALALYRAAHCELGPRYGKSLAQVHCLLPPAITTQRVAYALFKRIADPALVISYQTARRQPVERAVPPELMAALSRASAEALDGAPVIAGLDLVERCGIEAALDEPTFGLPLFSTTAAGPRDVALRNFETGALLARALLRAAARQPAGH